MLKKAEKIQNDFLKPEVVKAAKNKLFTCTASIVPAIVETKFGDKLRLSGMFDGNEYTFTPNNTTKDSLIDEFGEDETMWTGKEVLLGTEKTMTGDGMKNAIYTAKHIKESSDWFWDLLDRKTLLFYF